MIDQLFRVERGCASDDEIAALTVVLMAVAASRSARSITSRDTDPPSWWQPQRTIYGCAQSWQNHPVRW
jgi:hypothetical protein